MKRGILALLTAVFLAGVGTAQAQFFVYDSDNNNYVTANKNFVATPTSWQNYESAPASGYTGPSFSYAGLNSDSAKLNQARFLANDRMQINDNTNFHYMVAFDFPASQVKSMYIKVSTYGAGVAGDDTYLILHDSTQGLADGWYATLLHSRTAVSAVDYTVNVADATWYAFTPSTVNGTVPLGTIGSVVDTSVITGGTFDEAGYYADVYDNGLGVLNHYLWALAVYAPVTELVLDPADEVQMVTPDAAAVITNTFAVSYLEGAPPANVEITAVSVVNQSHAGSFANVTTLPLTLSSPSPATEDVSIEFNTATAGLAAGGIATGTVEIVWNEVGSASSSTSSVPVSAIYPLGADAIIATFDNTFMSADRQLPGISAVISGGAGFNANYGSTDTSYGSVFGDAPTSKNAMSASMNAPTVVVAITNTTPDTEVFFDSLNFDIGRRWTKAPNKVTVSIAGDIDNNASMAVFSNFTEQVGNSPYLGDYDDLDVDLTGLADRSLAYGESASFTLTVSEPIDPSNPDSLLAVDNIALLGSLVSGTLFVTDPADELAMNIDAPLGVVTGAVAVSYIEASSMPTNATISSVSIVNQSHGGFANATTLPLVLNSPVPASESVLIEFDNGTAGLTVGQTATGLVEIVWSEVGSASSATSTVAVSAMYLEVHSGNTIAIFDHRSENASPRLGGLVATLSGYHSLNGDRGSTDGTYGTLTGNARTDDGCIQGALNFPVISMAITNNTGYPCTFDSLHFDAARGWAKGPKTVTVSISGDVTANASLFTNPTDLPAFNGAAADYPDFDVPLTGLADRTLAHGEVALIEFTWSNGDSSNSNAVSILDNIALLGSGVNGAVLTKVPGGEVVFGISGLSLSASELIEMGYAEGDAATNVVITGVTVSEETHAGAFSYSGSLPLSLTAPDSTNAILTVLFDNIVANLAAGETAAAVLEIAWNEIGAGARTFDLNVSATRPGDVPTNTVIALLDTEFLTADAAVNGVLTSMDGGARQYVELGSADGTYGSLATPAAPTGTSRWRVSGEEQLVTLTITNSSIGDVELSTLNFDIGRWYAAGSDEFTLSVSGDVTDNPTLLVSSLSVMGFQNYDFDDHDVDLTGLTDHTLSAGESVTFTFTLTPKEGAEGYNVWLDNIALMGTFDLYGGWGNAWALTPGEDGPYDNPDGDGKNNFMEYATGGDPMTADGAAAAMWQAEEGGTNWFYYVHAERLDDPSLSYEVGAKDNLLWSPVWTNANLEMVGETSGPGVWKTVTNRTDMGMLEYIRLQVEQN